MPDTKPDLHFNADGVCNACSNYMERKAVDWEARREEFCAITEKYKSKNNNNWDCIVPVSGGKDSTYQVLRVLEYGLNPLCVTASTCDLSDIGHANLENIKKLGVDCVCVSPNVNVRAKLNRIGLTQVGDISWPEHIGIFTIPVRAAVAYKIPLIIWGENPQNEYGGPASATKSNILNRRWLEEFGGLLGLRLSDIVGLEGIVEKELLTYTYPTDEELKDVGVTGLFLGYYFPWDGISNALLAQANGLTCYSGIIEGSMVNYENLDNHQTGIHDYFKYLKFGFGRATDLACMHIRRGRISREQGMKIVNKHDGKFPWSYLGKPLVDILAPLKMNLDDFVAICDKFTNRKIFKTDARGNLMKDRDGNLIKIYPLE